MARPLAALLAAALLASLGLPACGGDAGEEYGEDFPPVSRAIVSLGQEVGDAIQAAGGSTDAELAREFEGFARELDELEQRLADLEAPEDLAEEQDALTEAMGDVQGSLSDIAEAAEQGDPDAARQATVDLVEQSRRLRDARRSLAQAVRDL